MHGWLMLIYDLRWILGFGLVLVAFMALVVRAENRQEQAFMDECLADGKKNYECVAMWGAGKTTYIYMPSVHRR